MITLGEQAWFYDHSLQLQQRRPGLPQLDGCVGCSAAVSGPMPSLVGPSFGGLGMTYSPNTPLVIAGLLLLAGGLGLYLAKREG